VRGLYYVSVALLPWTWFPPFPWLHEHAQWSDAVFAATAVAWAAEKLFAGARPRFQPLHAALGLYFLAATLSLLFASADRAAAAPKLLGIGELCMLALITSDLASRQGASRGIGRAVAITSLATFAAAFAGLALFYGGVNSQLVGIYGELEPSRWYARLQAGTYNPNLLASFCIFAAAVVSRRDSGLPAWLKRITLAALWLTVIFTFSRGILGFILAAAIRNATTSRRKKFATLVGIACVVLMASATLLRPKLDPSHLFETRFEQIPTSRFVAATTSLATVYSHPIFGRGPDSHPGYYQGHSFDSHCTPINIAGTLGLPALMIFASLIAALWRRRVRPIDLALWGGMAGLALDGLAQDVEEFRHIWVLIGLADVQQTFESAAPQTPHRRAQ
jgi:hypothetical protein